MTGMRITASDYLEAVRAGDHALVERAEHVLRELHYDLRDVVELRTYDSGVIEVDALDRGTKLVRTHRYTSGLRDE